ncbi:MAG: TIGR04133 family radical SAM/SPASM protein [Saprospiraceae bacterium]|nr:TIGR04133 family radical SAM/SPASM protein [Saprospiraceae bacterium]
MSKNQLSLKKKLALNVFNKYAKVQAEIHELTYLFWECTLRCNISCLHCGSDCQKDNKSTDMPYEAFLEVTRQVAKKYNPNKTMIVITGGEPLLRQDLEKVGVELYKQGFPWGFVTNGYALSKERFRSLMNSGLRSVTVSLDGFEEDHNWLRGKKDSFKKAINAIEFIVKEPDLVYDVVTCVNQKNFPKLQQFKKFLIEKGVKKWRLFTIFPIGRAKDNALLDITNEQFKWIMEFIKECRKEGKIIASYGCEGFLGSYENEVRDGFFLCRAGINIGSVLNDGSIGACPNINHAYIQGNIYEDDFLDVWENKFQIMRNRNWTKTGICENCDMFKYCRGNGMHLHEPDNPNVLRCHYNMITEE